MFRATARAFAVDRLGAGDNDLFDRQIFFTNDFEHLCSSERIHMHIFRDLGHVPAVSRLMENDIDISQSLSDRLAIAQIPLLEVGLFIDPRRFAAFMRVRLDVIENAHAPSFFDEQVCQVGSDQSRPACDQRPLRILAHRGPNSVATLTVHNLLEKLCGCWRDPTVSAKQFVT